MDELVEKFNILIKRIAAGDVSALDVIYEQYGGLLFAMAKKYITNQSYAEDAVSEALCKIVRGAKGFDYRKNGLNWAFKIVQNVCYDINKQEQEYIPVDSDTVDSLVDILDPISNNIEMVDLRNALQQLSSEENRLLYLKYWEGLTVREISRKISLPKSSVHYNLQIALKKLHNILK